MHRTSKPKSTLKNKTKSDSMDSCVPKIPLKFKIKKIHIDPEAPIPTTKQIDLENMTEAQQLSYTSAKSAQEAEAQANVKLVEQHRLDEDKGKSVMEVSDTSIATQPTSSPRIPLSSDKEKLQELTDSLEPTFTNITFLKAILTDSRSNSEDEQKLLSHDA
ncbi:hypothetical protein Tco_0544973 [Tanacetum coccineum]